ncbi:MAG: DUF6049 family protein [Pseudonocardiaceae bacterium]
MRHRNTGRFRVPALLVAILAGLALPGLLGLAPSAFAQPAYQPQRPQTLARIELVDMSPRVVTTGSTPVLRISGRVVNIGDRSITKLGVRLQIDDPVTTDEAASSAIRGIPRAPHVTRFRPLPDDLAPGQSSPFHLEVALRGGADQESLKIENPGVYPLLVNLNGKPDFGGTARLAAVPLLLPVLGVPPLAEGGTEPGPVLKPPPRPTPVTVVWPLAAEPVRLPTAPGDPILLRGNDSGSDSIAVQIAPGGRLDGLVGALEQAVPPGSPLASAVCIAIDPLLLETVEAMSHGYRVARPDRTSHRPDEISEGTGAEDARSWLARLRSAVQGRCVMPLPYADPDLVALSRAGLTDLEALATSTGIRLVRTLLEVQPLTGVTWPSGGVLDERTLADLVSLQTRAVLLEPHGLIPPPLSGPAADSTDNIVGLAGTPGSGGVAPFGLRIDPLLTGALDPGAVVGDPETPRPEGNATTVAARPTDTANPLAAQDGLGALVYRAGVDPDREPILLVPPRRWKAGGQEATELLRSARELVEAGFLAPRELAELTDTDPAGRPALPSVAVSYPPQADTTEIPPAVTSAVEQARNVLRDLQVATVRDPTVDLEPIDLLDPLRLGLLRGMSTAWAGRPDRAEQVTREIQTRLDELLQSVRILPSPGPYSLAASDSPLLITVGNELPTGVQVQLNLSDTAGLQAGTVGVELVPARSTRQFVIPAEISRAGQFIVDARLSTPGGISLGQPSTLHLRSTAFGTITIVLTAGAGTVLVLLMTRRFISRVRKARKAD